MSSSKPSALCLTNNYLLGLGIREALCAHGINRVDLSSVTRYPSHPDRYARIFLVTGFSMTRCVKRLVQSFPNQIVVLYERTSDPLLYELFEMGVARFMSTNMNAAGLGFHVELRRVMDMQVSSYISSELVPLLLARQKQHMTCELTDRELQIVSLLWQGLDNFEISEELNLSVRTVERYRSSILKKTDSRNMVAAVRYCFDKGFINKHLKQPA